MSSTLCAVVQLADHVSIEVRFSAPDDLPVDRIWARHLLHRGSSIRRYGARKLLRAVEEIRTTCSRSATTGVNVTIRPPPRFVSAIRSGIGSPRFAIASDPTGPTTTTPARSVPDNESTKPSVFGRYRHGHNRVPISAVVWRNGHDAQIMAACALEPPPRTKRARSRFNRLSADRFRR